MTDDLTPTEAQCQHLHRAIAELPRLDEDIPDSAYLHALDDWQAGDE